MTVWRVVVKPMEATGQARTSTSGHDTVTAPREPASAFLWEQVRLPWHAASSRVTRAACPEERSGAQCSRMGPEWRAEGFWGRGSGWGHTWRGPQKLAEGARKSRLSTKLRVSGAWRHGDGRWGVRRGGQPRGPLAGHPGGQDTRARPSRELAKPG